MKDTTHSATSAAAGLFDRNYNGQLDLFGQEGPFYALRWALATKAELTEKDQKQSKLIEREYRGDAPHGVQYTAADVATHADEHTEDKNFSLKDVPWDSPHVKALLTDFDEGYMHSDLPSNERIPWMDPKKAEEILKQVTVDDMTKFRIMMELNDNIGTDTVDDITQLCNMMDFEDDISMDTTE